MNNDEVVLRTGAPLLETLTSALYADPLVVFREYVQNSVDNFISSVDVERKFSVSITVDAAARRITISDNGTGISQELFQKTMTSLGLSSKQNRGDQIGFRGIGRLAGLAFCDRLVFTNKKYGQRFALDGKTYRTILNDPERRLGDLETVLQRISSFETLKMEGRDDLDATNEGFVVELCEISRELMAVIYGASRNGEGASVSEKKMSAEFIHSLRMMLPLPYASNFDKGEEIAAAYQTHVGKSLRDKEFSVFLNGEMLTKPFAPIGDRAFVLMPIRIDGEMEEGESGCVGIIWISFEFLLRSMRKNFGVAVRSKNMLVQRGPVFASEASQSGEAITSYGQYLAATKAITGELLLDTNKLSDNSRRDWFKLDAYAFKLRDIICDIMNRIHAYRYAMSRYMNSDTKDEEGKNKVRAAYQAIQDVGKEFVNLKPVEGFLSQVEKLENERTVDERADESDIRGYTRSQKDFYRTLMLKIYDYFNRTDEAGITGYYSLKSYLVKKLNNDEEDR